MLNNVYNTCHNWLLEPFLKVVNQLWTFQELRLTAVVTKKGLRDKT
jgi:hypothetical protein